MSFDSPADSSGIRTLLLSDHRRLDALLQKLVAAFEANDREDIQELWSEFETGLNAHLEAEERVLIPALQRVSSVEAALLLADHDRFRSRLVELGAGIDLHIVRLETARAFAAELLSHAEREDQMLYQWSDLHLDATVRASFLADFANAVRRTARNVLKTST